MPSFYLEEDMDNNVIDIDEYLPHTVSEVICVNCATRWISVRPEVTLLKQLECPGCGKVGCVIETGERLDVQT